MYDIPEGCKEHRLPNSQECKYHGRKLSSLICDIRELDTQYIETNVNHLCIGSDSDDEIYDFDGLNMVKERVKIYLTNEGIEIDLEDVLRFSANHCNGIYERVRKELN